MIRTPFFRNVYAKIYRYQETDEFDKYGEKIGEYGLSAGVEADFQPVSMQEQQKDSGVALSGLYALWVAEDVEIHSSDRIQIAGRCYEIVGNVENWNHFLNHKKIILKEARK